jgi:quercetin dioxygenase-like cupin family protein
MSEAGNGADGSFSVNRQELANLLRTFRIRREETREAVETRLQDAVKPRRRAAARHGVEPVVFPGRVAALERGGHGPLSLSEEDWRRLADAYAIPRLMLDPLRVPIRDELCLSQRRDRLIPLGRGSAREYGENVSYFAPEVKRAGTEESAFVLLDLKPGGDSQTHAHPGDELMFVLKGAVEARLETTGLSIRLGVGDCLHFYSEQRHGISNPGRSRAQVFIIRFYQLGRSSTRSELLKQLRQTQHHPDLTIRAVREMIALLTPTDLREGELITGEVRDRGGLGRLLHLLCTEKFRGSGKQLPVRTLSDELRKLGLDYAPAKVGRIQLGQAPVAASDFEHLAKVYGAEPLMLFEFLYPALRPAIAVRQQTDYRDVPRRLIRSSRAIYRVPCRRLADSDLGVARLILPKNAATPVNRHPGHELLVPLVGRARIRIGGMTADINAKDHLFAHYSSEVEHEVINTGDEQAEFLVVRFYE